MVVKQREINEESKGKCFMRFDLQFLDIQENSANDISFSWPLFSQAVRYEL